MTDGDSLARRQTPIELTGLKMCLEKRRLFYGSYIVQTKLAGCSNEFGDRKTVKVEDWRTEVLQLIRDGVFNLEELEAEVGTEEARRLFDTAGVRKLQSGEIIG